MRTSSRCSSAAVARGDSPTRLRSRPPMRPHVAPEDEDLVIDGRRVVRVAGLSGTDTGGFMGLPPTGRTFIAPLVVTRVTTTASERLALSPDTLAALSAAQDRTLRSTDWKRLTAADSSAMHHNVTRKFKSIRWRDGFGEAPGRTVSPAWPEKMLQKLICVPSFIRRPVRICVTFPHAAPNVLLRASTGDAFSAL